MLEHQQLYNTVRWKKARKRKLFDNPRCVMCLAMNRQTAATVVYHIIPHCGDSELFWDENNYQSLCKRCHDSKTWYETTKSTRLPNNIKPRSKDITILFGAPCSGKTTYANNQDCTVIDFDDIKRKLSGKDYDMPSHYIPTCIAIRNKMIEQSTGSVIIVTSLPNARTREDWLNKLKAKALMMITPEHECIRRLKKTDRPNIQGQVALIRRWFKEFRPLGNESFIS